MLPETLAEYESSSDVAIYKIIKGGDSVVYCDCPGWKMRRNCKHLLDFTANGARSALNVFNTAESREVFTTPNAPPAKTTTGDKDLDIAIQNAARMMGSNR